MAESEEDILFDKLKTTCQITPEVLNLNSIQHDYKYLFISLTNSLQNNETPGKFCHHGDFTGCNSVMFEKDKLLFGNIIHWIQDVYVFGTILHVDDEINKIRNMKMNTMLKTEDVTDMKIYKDIKERVKITTDEEEKKNLELTIGRMGKMGQKKKKIVKDFKKIDEKLSIKYKNMMEEKIKLYSFESSERIGFVLNMIDRIIYFRGFDASCKEIKFTYKMIRENREKYEYNLKVVHDHDRFISVLDTYKRLLIEHSRVNFGARNKDEFESIIKQNSFEKFKK